MLVLYNSSIIYRWRDAKQNGCFSLSLSLVLIDRIFLIENLAEMAALGIKKFFTQLFLVLDFAVVLISLVFELVFHFNKSQLQQVAEILILFRVWRFVRIGHVSLS